MGEKDEFFAEDAGAVVIWVAEVGVLDEGEDDEGGDTHEAHRVVLARGREGAGAADTSGAPIVRE